MTDDEPLIMPTQIPPECIKTFEELIGLGATPQEILAGVLDAWPGSAQHDYPDDPGHLSFLYLPILTEEEEPRT